MAQIKQKTREMRLQDAQAEMERSANTRTNMSLGGLQERWSDRMTTQERAALAALSSRIGRDAELVDQKAATWGVEQAISHCFDRQSVVPERKILEIPLRGTVGKTTIDRIREKTRCSGLIVGELKGRCMVTTRGVFGQERQVVAFAINGVGA